MKKTVLTMGLLSTLALGGLATPALADGEEGGSSSGFSGTVALTSDYRFRGVSQTDNSVALQGSIEYGHSSGLSAGVWASNIDFNDEATYNSGIEVDFYVGYTAALSDQTEVTLKAVYYWYADANAPAGFPSYDYYEVIGGLSHNFGKATLSAEVAWTPDYFAESGDAYAVTGGLEVPLYASLWIFDGGIEASGHVGHQSFDNVDLDDYGYWDLGLTATIGKFAIDARYVDTDVDTAICGDICDSSVVVTGTFEFGM